MSRSGRLYLVDAHSLIYQVFHAIPEMSSPSGLPTNAVFGFTKDLLALRDLKPEYLVVAFDAPGKVFREDIYAEYKANRAPMPDDLRTQIGMIHRVLAGMRVAEVSKPGFEADDIIATVARRAAGQGLDVIICSTDKDCRQLIDERIKLLNLRKNKTMDRSALEEDWGIKPEQVVDLQAMVGDSVDNVPGVPGIGLKTAAKLLQEFGSLDNILTARAAGNLTGMLARKSIQENLRQAADKVALSRQLVKLADDIPIDWDWEGWKLQEWDGPTLLALFEEYGFQRFSDQVRKTVVVRSKPAKTLFPELDDDEPEELPSKQPVLEDDWQATYLLVDTPEKLSDFLKALEQQERFAFDLETTSLSPRQAALVGIAFCWQEGTGWYLPIRAPMGTPTLDEQEVLAALKPIFEDPKIAKINQNIKYEQIVLREHNIHLAGIAGDPMVADYLLHAGARSHNLDELCRRYLNHQVVTIEELIGKGKKQQTMDMVPAEKIAYYAGEDADCAFRLCNIVEPMLKKDGLDKLYGDTEVPLIEVLAELEYNGVRLDLPRLAQLSEEMAGQLAEMEVEIHDLAGRKFNIASPSQLRKVLFDDLKLPRQRRTKQSGEASTDQETLERLAALGHPLPVKIVEHRQIAKLKGTYVDALPGLVNPDTGRVHASFNQTVAATGRLSSSDPNLQNIPIRTEQGRHVRQAFLPEPGWVLLAADYSQIELRLLAHLAEDEALRRAFAEDRDIHAAVAAQIYGVTENDVTAEMRRTAKTVNFGVIYGMSAYGLAQRLGITKEEGAKFIETYFSRYASVMKYQDTLLAECRTNRYVSTLLGRRREITGIRARTSYQQRTQPEREAINMAIQGSAADLIKLAMLHIHERLKREQRQARMILSVHDELVFEVPPEELGEVALLVEEEMTRALPLEVPLKVDMAAGPNWLDVEELSAVGA
ncbi:MAG: DNA polymerase I [Gemmataceae bacterium]